MVGGRSGQGCIHAVIAHALSPPFLSLSLLSLSDFLSLSLFLSASLSLSLSPSGLFSRSLAVARARSLISLSLSLSLSLTKGTRPTASGAGPILQAAKPCGRGHGARGNDCKARHRAHAPHDTGDGPRSSDGSRALGRSACGRCARGDRRSGHGHDGHGGCARARRGPPRLLRRLQVRAGC